MGVEEVSELEVVGWLEAPPPAANRLLKTPQSPANQRLSPGLSPAQGRAGPGKKVEVGLKKIFLLPKPKPPPSQLICQCDEVGVRA